MLSDGNSGEAHILDFETANRLVQEVVEVGVAVQEEEQASTEVQEVGAPGEGLEVRVVEGREEKGRYVRVTVNVTFPGDMMGTYCFQGLSGPSGILPSPYTLVPAAHLKGHATSGLPHNWEQECCIFPYRDPEDLFRNWVACSRDPRNQGNPAKNAKYHFGSKACPILQLPSSVNNFLEVFPPFPPPGSRHPGRVVPGPHDRDLQDHRQDCDSGGAGEPV